MRSSRIRTITKIRRRIKRNRRIRSRRIRRTRSKEIRRIRSRRIRRIRGRKIRRIRKQELSSKQLKTNSTLNPPITSNITH